MFPLHSLDLAPANDKSTDKHSPSQIVELAHISDDRIAVLMANDGNDSLGKKNDHPGGLHVLTVGKNGNLEKVASDPEVQSTYCLAVHKAKGLLAVGLANGTCTFVSLSIFLYARDYQTNAMKGLGTMLSFCFEVRSRIC